MNEMLVDAAEHTEGARISADAAAASTSTHPKRGDVPVAPAMPKTRDRSETNSDTVSADPMMSASSHACRSRVYGRFGKTILAAPNRTTGREHAVRPPSTAAPGNPARTCRT